MNLFLALNFKKNVQNSQRYLRESLQPYDDCTEVPNTRELITRPLIRSTPISLPPDGVNM